MGDKCKLCGMVTKTGCINAKSAGAICPQYVAMLRVVVAPYVQPAPQLI